MNFLFFNILMIAVAILLEGAVTTLPLVLICLLCLTIIRRDSVVFIIAFLAGIFLDLFQVHVVAESSLFFVLFVFLILLYQRKYEINSYQFVAAASFLGSFAFLLLFGGGNWFWQSLVSSFIAIILLGTLRKLRRPEIQNI